MRLSQNHDQSIKNITYGSRFLNYKYFYLMLIPVLVWYFIFTYMPMYGVILAFKSFSYNKGILLSPWVGLDNFKDLMRDSQFWTAFKNTLSISLGKLIFHFPTPIILAVLLNEITRSKLKKVYQTIFTFPHFISWVVLSGIIINIFGQNGLFNQITSLLGLGVSPDSPLLKKSTFRSILYISQIWKEMGWDSIIYLAALAGINPELYQAASIDGANRFQRMIHITWPGIRNTVTILLILNIGQFMNSGFEQIFNLYSSPVYSVADIIDTYVYRMSFAIGSNFGYVTAAGLFKSVINLILLYSANFFAKRLGEDGLF